MMGILHRVKMIQFAEPMHDTNQGNSRCFGDNQACNDSIPGEMGVKEGDNGSMEVEGH